jgi:predicted dehydrogenase
MPTNSNKRANLFAIFGSGFGLYGYLPALIGCGQSIVLPSKYRERFQSRRELTRFSDRIEWAADETDALTRASGVVIALRPADQSEWIPRCMAYPQLTKLMLEKPLAPTPSEALHLQQLLLDSKKSFRIGYTFCGTMWMAQLRAFAASDPEGEVAVNWKFLAHHYRHELSNWKRWSNSGGGAIRFYGIQLIAALAEMGYSEVIESKSFGSSELEISRWTAVISGEGLPVCRLVVNSKSDTTQFSVHMRSARGDGSRIIENDDPFVVHGRDLFGLDNRVGLLEDLVRPLIDQPSCGLDWYAGVLNLWHQIEQRSVFSKH